MMSNFLKQTLLGILPGSAVFHKESVRELLPAGTNIIFGMLRPRPGTALSYSVGAAEQGMVFRVLSLNLVYSFSIACLFGPEFLKVFGWRWTDPKALIPWCYKASFLKQGSKMNLYFV